MKNLIYSLFLFVSFYCTGQDSIRGAGYGSMSNLPPQPSKKGEIAHFEFSHLQKNTTLEVTLWCFKESFENISKTVILHEQLNIKENPRVDIIIQKNKINQIEICCNFIGKFFSGHPLRSDTTITSYIIKSLPRTKEKVVPVMLFIEKGNPIGNSILDKITNLHEFEIDKDKRILKELFSYSSSFKILTYQLKEK